MFAFKDKVTDSLSRLFADSPDSASRSSTPLHGDPSPGSRSFSKGGNALSSYFSYILPFSGFEGPKSNQPQKNYKLHQPRPVPYDIVNFDSLEPLECSLVCENKGIRDNEEDFDDSVSGRSTSSSEVFEEATCQSSPEKIVTNLTGSTLKHGISLRTLIRKSGELSGPCLLVVGDQQGAVFGGLLECPLKPTAKRKYQGTNQTFVFTTMCGEPQLFRPTGANRYFYMCMDDLLALGGGSNFALRLEEDLLNGTSGPCETFGNSCLAHTQEFELKNVELWGFAHASQYVS
uniref:TLDc domain-containing protein n=1 Tax=Cucumis melo TaxID=3656 RepID=A0A9I9CP60_CUCME